MPDAYYQSFTETVKGTECFACGAYVTSHGFKQHDQFHKSYTYLRNEHMSNVSWCDLGDHAYKAWPERIHHLHRNPVRRSNRTSGTSIH